ncbi:MAG: ribosome small subunit-dependent GTPase A [Oscillospiraceae bacterium]|nr:ribosome small subunit-dependent GTPase A [Oscillospiraceae bacterium]
MTLTGRLVRSVSGFYTVRHDAGEVVCRARGIFRLKGVTPLAGDFVTVEMLPDGTGSILEVAERRNALVRPPVCNIDKLVILISEATPRTDMFIIDKMTAMAAYRSIDVILILNKTDIDPGDALYENYRTVGFPILRVSALTGDGLMDIWPLIEGRCIALAGNSGVGKSALLNALEGGGEHETGEVSERLGRGRHTTRHVELFRLPRNVLAADTPGFAALDALEPIPSSELASCFLDFRPFLDGCRFAGCLHAEGQKDCAVRDAVADGLVRAGRYESYLRMLEGTG